MHPQHELDHINSVFHQNYRDAHLVFQPSAARRARRQRVAAIGNNMRTGIGTMLIVVGDRIRPQAISEPESATGSDAETSGAFAAYILPDA